MQAARIRFLGVWDTVPGSSLKNYRGCKEDKGFIKSYLWWLIPGIDRGERYKAASYPPISEIAHAVALDEKRSKFAPLLVCEAINPEYTKVTEVWFPGAHADVGGGYEDSTDLPSVSLRWMIQMLGNSYTLEPPPAIEGAAVGLAHWSIGDSPGNIGSECIDRNPPPAAIIHSSAEERSKSTSVPILWEGEERLMNYPISCAVFE